MGVYSSFMTLFALLVPLALGKLIDEYGVGIDAANITDTIINNSYLLNIGVFENISTIELNIIMFQLMEFLISENSHWYYYLLY